MQFNFRLKDTDEDRKIMEHLQNQVNASQYLRELIRADMANRVYTDQLIRRIREEWLRTGELEIENADLKARIMAMKAKHLIDADLLLKDWDYQLTQMTLNNETECSDSWKNVFSYFRHDVEAFIKRGIEDGKTN